VNEGSKKIVALINIDCFEIIIVTVCFFEVRFLAALASWLCRLHSFWLFLADQLGKNFGQQFFLKNIFSVQLIYEL